MNEYKFSIVMLREAGYTEKDLEEMDLSKLTKEITVLLVMNKYRLLLNLPQEPNPLLIKKEAK